MIVPKEKKTDPSKSATRKAVPKRNVVREIRHRRERPLVLVNFDPSPAGAEQFYKRAAELRWQLVDLRFRRGDLPPNLTVRGVVTTMIPSAKEAATVMELGCPVVRIGNMPHPMDHKVPAVMPGRYAAGRLAAEHFHERGFEHLGYVGRDPWGDAKALYDGLQQRAAELGCESHLLQLKPGAGKSYGERYGDFSASVGAWLRTVPKPLGLLGFCDPWAAELCSMCTDAGYSVPEQVAILGYGNDPGVGQCTLPPLSTVVPDHERVFAVAADLLQRLMNGETPAETTVMIPPKGVITRASTDILAVDNPMVARAMRFMWEHLDLDLSVDDVAREVGVAGRTLRRAFSRSLGRSFIAELQRRRLAELCRLLRSTDDPIADLAPRVGFRTMAHLHRCFRRAYDMSPRQYRVQEKRQSA